jgi:hypothetical protein
MVLSAISLANGVAAHTNEVVTFPRSTASSNRRRSHCVAWCTFETLGRAVILVSLREADAMSKSHKLALERIRSLGRIGRIPRNPQA